jgi:hypothetical protein
MECIGYVNTGIPEKAWKTVEGAHLDDAQKLGLWALLDSKTRSAIKKAGQALKEAQPA